MCRDIPHSNQLCNKFCEHRIVELCEYKKHTSMHTIVFLPMPSCKACVLPGVSSRIHPGYIQDVTHSPNGGAIRKYFGRRTHCRDTSQLLVEGRKNVVALCTEEALSDLRTSLPGNFNETGGRISQTKQVEARGGMEREHSFRQCVRLPAYFLIAELRFISAMCPPLIAPTYYCAAPREGIRSARPPCRGEGLGNGAGAFISAMCPPSSIFPDC